MKALLLFVLIIAHLTVSAQNRNDSLVTSIGWVIHKGDSVILGKGSEANSDFAFLAEIGLSTSLTNTNDPNYNRRKNTITNHFVGMCAVVEKIRIAPAGIKYVDIKMGKKWAYTKAAVNIEGAIASGEIVVPEQYSKKQSNLPVLSKADELTKLKKLLDDGVLTKEEFEAEKKKLLEK